MLEKSIGKRFRDVRSPPPQGPFCDIRRRHPTLSASLESPRMLFSDFITKWSASSGAERANKDLFLNDLCAVLDVPGPNPKGADEDDAYVFERDAQLVHEGEKVTVGWIDLYKQGCFILEAKQGSSEGRRKIGTARRGTPAWNIAMHDAFGQALGYARTFDNPPPFIITCDLGHCFDLYAAFDGSTAYRPFPDALRHRIFLTDLEAHLPTLRAIWTDPLSLDPAKHAAKVTREVATHLAELARALDAAGHPSEAIAQFLMRCLFTMFAEDVGLLPNRLFSDALENRWLERPDQFQGGCRALWQAMDLGAHFGLEKLLRFNGGLFAEPHVLPLTREHLKLLVEAAKCDWSEVEPAIFGTLLERALDPKKRHQLGAHFTPRAYVERLVRPTVEEPLRAEWDLVRAEVRQLVAEGKEESARGKVRDFHARLCKVRVLDPACGAGNFLYVTLDLMKRLEDEVLELLQDLGDRQMLLAADVIQVGPAQFHGIEVERWAKEIAELVLWIGYLQWHHRRHGKVPPKEPVLRDYKNIECRDAVLAWDAIEPLVDEHGLSVTRWDGESFKTHPVTGEQVPDETKRVPVVRYVNPRKATWPKVDFVVGNPPFIGASNTRRALGDGYVDAMRAVWSEVPESADLVMHWWHIAAQKVRAGQASRFGLITTNSIRQTFNRRIVQAELEATPPLSLAFAIPDHPWVDSADGAAVRIAMTVGMPGDQEGRLLHVIEERETEEHDEVEVTLEERRGRLFADLRMGVNVASAQPLQANLNLANRGVQLFGAGFIVSPEEATKLGLGHTPGLEQHIRTYRNGRDLTDKPRAVMVIDLFGLSAEEVRDRFPAVYQHVLEHVKPERDQNNRATYRNNWWVFGEPRRVLRQQLAGLPRFIATVETAKHRTFQFLDAAILPDNKLVNIASDEAFVLGVLSSRAHVVWALATGGTLEDRPRYNKTRCFETFPFPVCNVAQKDAIGRLGEAIDAHRKRQQAAHPDLTLTGIYNVLEKLRSGESLTAKEKVIHENGLVSLLRQFHDELDAAVFDAYGWPRDLSEEQILERLVALNSERVAEEKDGLIRWLRPEFQNPKGAKQASQVEIAAVAKKNAKSAKTASSSEKLAWPKGLPERIAAVRDLLSRGKGMTEDEIASAFKGAKADAIGNILQSLNVLGIAVRYRSKGTVRWKSAG